MIEIIVCEYLSEKLNITVLPEKPARPFSNMVFVERTGGRGRFIKESTLAIQSYGSSMYEAAQLNDEVIDAMYGLIERDEITHVELNQTYNFTDTNSKEYRYQAVFDITHY